MKKYDEISKKEVYICNCCGQMIASVDECDRAAFLQSMGILFKVGWLYSSFPAL